MNQAFGALRRRVEAAFAPVAAEIARQSRVELGKDSLAKKQGFRSAPRIALTGEELSAKHPHVGAGVHAGALSVATASAIVSMLDRIDVRVDAGRLDAAERELVGMAPGLRADELARLLARAEATLDPDGLELRHEQARAERSLEIREHDGRFRITGELDIETGAPIKTVIDAMVTATLRANHDTDDATRDQRTLRQMRADALATLCRHAIGCDQLPTGPSTTVIVRITLDELQTGVGAATIDGIDQPLPAAALRRLACDLQVLPWVMGSDSEILDWGRDKRGFTRAQKLALALRDGGCACCGAPVAWTEVHHIQWWSKNGPTDLSNGILLCAACHHRIHDDGWDIHIDGTGLDAKIWFIPPPWIDRTQTPRPGGKRRYTLSA